MVLKFPRLDVRGNKEDVVCRVIWSFSSSLICGWDGVSMGLIFHFFILHCDRRVGCI